MGRNEIGAFIAELRRESGMTQQQLAERLNVSNKTVSKWERGDGYPEITLIPEIADIFGVTSDELLRGRRAYDGPAADYIVPDERGSKEPETYIIPVKEETQVSPRITSAMIKYKGNSFIAMGVALLGFVLMLISAYGLNAKIIGFGISVVFAFACIVFEIVNICAARPALSIGQEDVPEQLKASYELFFKYILFVFTVAPAAVLLSLPSIIMIPIEFPDGTVMTDFVYYLHSAKYMVLCAMVLYLIFLFVMDQVLTRKSRYEGVNVMPRSKIKVILWLLLFIVLIAI